MRGVIKSVEDIKTESKFWDMINIRGLFSMRKNGKKWGNIRIKIGSKMIEYKNEN